MSIVYTGANGGSYTNTITGPSPGDLVTAASVGVIAQGAANLSKRLYDTKVERTGDTMTGTLNATAAAASASQGLFGTGDGIGSGVRGDGGTTNGIGVEGNGGITNGKGVVGTGAGTGSGGDFSGGATGKGIRCSAGGGTAVALEVGAGNMVLTGTPLATNTDPGANYYMSGASICHAWGTITVTAGVATLEDGIGISTAINEQATYIEITFKRAFATKNYAPVVSNDSNNQWWAETDFASRTTTTVRIFWRDGPTGGLKDPTSDTLNVTIHVFGRQ